MTDNLTNCRGWKDRTSLKAYIVTEPEENIGGVIYATSDIEARRRGADEYSDGELGGMSCRRAPELDDKRGDKRAITLHLLAMGWWFESAAIGDGTLTDDDNPFVTIEGEIYRTPYQWLAAAETDAIAQANARRVREWAESKWWYAEDLYVRADGTRGYAVTLYLPHLQHSVIWESARPEFVTLSATDMSAWRTLYGQDFLNLEDQLPRVRFASKMGGRSGVAVTESAKPGEEE